jgi:hypothetical protein
MGALKVWDGSAWQLASLATGATLCTASPDTRPTSPFAGQVIWETDLEVARVWDGSAWKVVGFRPRFARTYRTTDSPALTDGTVTTIDFGTLDYESDPGFGDTPNGYLVAPIAGKYNIQCSLGFQTNSTGSRRSTRITVAGTLAQVSTTAPISGTNTHIEAATDWNCAAGDIIRGQGVHAGTGGTLSVIGGIHATWLAASLVAPADI